MNEEAEARVTALALAAAGGDRAALTAFVEATRGDVWRFLAHLTDTSRADDLAQETYMRALGSLPRFEGRSSGRVWLLSIARRVVVDQIRRESSRPKAAEGVDPGENRSIRRRELSAHRAALELAEVKILLAGLAPERREALVLTQVLGLTYAEVSAVCGCPVGTVRSRVARAREDLVEASRERPEDASRGVG